MRGYKTKVIHYGVRLLNNIAIRVEEENDFASIDQLNKEAFGGEGEAKLVSLLRIRKELLISLVATKDDEIIGHVCASPVTVNGNDHSIAGIGPLSVYESHRCCGIGGMLMEEVIAQLRNDGCVAAALLGNPTYYPRFGFLSGASFNLQNEYGAGDPFMAMELQEGALNNISGMVMYVSAFAECDA